MKIIKISKKPWYLRVGIEYYWAWVEKDGKAKRYSVWAGIHNPSVSNFVWDLERKVAGHIEAKSEVSFESLIGKEI